MIPCGSLLCYSGPYLLSLSLVCVLGALKMGVLRADQLSFFELIDVLHNNKSCRLSYFLCVGCWWVGYFASRPGVGVFLQSCLDWPWCFSSGPGVRWPSNLEVWWADRF